jgi:hypothetical protein
MRSETDAVRALVHEVLRTGLMLTDVLAGIVEDDPEDAFPGEEPAAVLVEMVVGSMRPVAEAAGPRVVDDTMALLGAIADRFVGDLEKALELARSRS